jgi:hypothetical protein
MKLIFILLLIIIMASCSLATGFVVLAEEVPPRIQVPEVTPRIQVPEVTPRIQVPKDRPYGNVFHVTKRLMCNDTPVVDEYILNNFGQVPQEFGMLLKDAMGNYGMITAVYVNPQTKTFSIIERAAQGLSCIVSTGEMWTTQTNDPKF